MKKQVSSKTQLDLLDSRQLQEIYDTTTDAIEQELADELKQINRDKLKQNIIRSVKKLKQLIQQYPALARRTREYGSLSLKETEQRLQRKIDLIYEAFFKVQNDINLYEGQKVVITFVAVDKNGRREIRLVDNDISHLKVVTGYRGPKTYSTIQYAVEEQYRLLKNTLPDEYNEDLQRVAQIATERYQETRKRLKKRRNGIIYWKTTEKMQGYSMHTVGPINEAFVNFYVNTPPDENYFNKQIEENVETFVLHPYYGVRNADTLNGFLVGDVQKNGIQYAVKGAGGGPQNFIKVIELLDEVVDGISHEELDKIIKNFREYTESPARVQSLAHEVIDGELSEILEKLNLEKS